MFFIPHQQRGHAAITHSLGIRVARMNQQLAELQINSRLIRHLHVLASFLASRSTAVFKRCREYVTGRTEPQPLSENEGLFRWLIADFVYQAQRTLRAGRSLDVFDFFLRDLSGGDISKETKEVFRLAVSELPEIRADIDKTWPVIESSRLLRTFLPSLERMRQERMDTASEHRRKRRRSRKRSDFLFIFSTRYVDTHNQCF